MFRGVITITLLALYTVGLLVKDDTSEDTTPRGRGDAVPAP